VGHDDPDRDRRPHQRDRGDRTADGRLPAAQRVPDPDARDHERHVLLGGGGEDPEDQRGDEPVLVEEPDRVEEERDRQRDGMEVVQRVPLDRRIEEVCDRERPRRAVVADVLAGEPEDGEGARGECERLHRGQQQRTRPEPPERREQDEQRVDVRAQPRHLLTGRLRYLERSPVGGAPHRLRHVPEVVPVAEEVCVAARGEHGEADSPGDHRYDDHDRRARDVTGETARRGEGAGAAAVGRRCG
jgi:hypothetical protein